MLAGLRTMLHSHLDPERGAATRSTGSGLAQITLTG